MNDEDRPTVSPDTAAIKIGWRPRAKSAALEIDLRQIGNWAFAVAVIEMAKDAERGELEGGPAIVICWDDEAQEPRVYVDSEQLKHDYMVEAVLDMAKEVARLEANIAQMQQKQQAHVEAQLAQQIKNGIQVGRG